MSDAGGSEKIEAGIGARNRRPAWLRRLPLGRLIALLVVIDIVFRWWHEGRSSSTWRAKSFSPVSVLSPWRC